MTTTNNLICDGCNKIITPYVGPVDGWIHINSIYYQYAEALISRTTSYEPMKKLQDSLDICGDCLKKHNLIGLVSIIRRKHGILVAGDM